jgi:hypothetical protein
MSWSVNTWSFVYAVQQVIENLVLLISSVLLLSSTVLKVAHDAHLLEVQLCLVALASKESGALHCQG